MAATSPVDQALQPVADGASTGSRARSSGASRTSAQVAGLEGELQRLGTDRSRLAQSLDAAEARSARLEEANREVSRRLVAAMESIRDVLAAQRRSLNRGRRTMAQVNVTISGKTYRMACDDGQEEHLEALGRSARRDDRAAARRSSARSATSGSR